MFFTTVMIKLIVLL